MAITVMNLDEVCFRARLRGSLQGKQIQEGLCKLLRDVRSQLNSVRQRDEQGLVHKVLRDNESQLGNDRGQRRGRQENNLGVVCIFVGVIYISTICTCVVQ